MIKFKTRTEEPKAIRLVFTNEDMPAAEYEKRMKWQGWFCLGYHYVLRANGIIEEGIPFEQFADPSLPDWKNSIYVIVMSEEITDVQTSSLQDLTADLNLPIVEGE